MIPLIVLVGLVSCSGDTTSEDTPITSLPTQTLVLYHSPTHATISTIAVPTLQPTLPPVPTSTPMTYTIKDGDTLLVIAEKFGLTLAELQLANPNADASFLSIGDVLIIPEVNENGEAAEMQSSAAIDDSLIVASSPVCYPISNGSGWCFAGINNISGSSLENLSGMIYLYDNEGEIIQSLEAFPPNNLIPPGTTIPLIAYVKEMPVNMALTQVQILSLVPVAEGDQKYLKTEIVEYSIDDQSNYQQTLSGTIRIKGKDQTAHTTWVTGVAYDTLGNIVGVKRWESEDEHISGDTVPFQFVLSSLSGPISSIELILEVRP